MGNILILAVSNQDYMTIIEHYLIYLVYYMDVDPGLIVSGSGTSPDPGQ